MEDNWKHRGQNMRCTSCMWWVEKSERRNPEQSVVGRCRRRAPTLGGWPVVMEDDWCGDHKLDEEKV